MVILLMAPLQWAFWTFKVQKKLVKREIKHRIIEGIDSLELTELRLSKTQVETELRWEHAKEFEFRGQMYDVVRKTETADSIVYVCWWDHEETRLNKKLKILTALSMNENPESNSRKEKLEQFLTFFYQIPDDSVPIRFHFIKSKFIQPDFSAVSDFYSSFFIPPEV